MFLTPPIGLMKKKAAAIGISAVGSDIDYQSTGTTVSFSLTMPPGMAAGDLMILFVALNEQGSSFGDIYPVQAEAERDKWHQLYTLSTATERLHVYYKFAGSSGEVVTPWMEETGQGILHGWAALLVLNGADAAVFEGSTSNANTANHSITHTEGTGGFTAIGILIEEVSNAITVNGSIKSEGADWTEVIHDSVAGAAQGAFALLYREDSNLGSETSGVTSVNGGGLDDSYVAACRSDPGDVPYLVGSDAGYSLGNNDITLTLPAAAAVGDLMLLCCGMDESVDNEGTINTPTSGGTWTLLGAGHADASSEVKIFYKTVGVGEPSPVALFTLDSSSGGTNDNFAVLLVFSNCSTTPVSEGLTSLNAATAHDVNFTDPADGITVLAQILENNGASILLNEQEAGWARHKIDNAAPYNASDGAFHVTWRHNLNRGATVGGVATGGTADSDSWRATVAPA